MTADLDILSKRDRKVGSLYRFDAGSDSLGLDTMAEPSLDLSAMSATVVISTPTIDREGDSLLPEGCDVTHYKTNPVVLWEHGMSQQGNLPIGKSEDPQGQFTVLIDRAAITATSFFSQSLAFAQQVFGLLAEKIVRGASVRARPEDYEQGRTGLLVKAWSLEEWSWVGIPCNPDAVMKTIRDKKIPGDRKLLDPMLLKSLSRWVPPSPLKSSVGWMPPKEATMAKSKTKAAPAEDDEEKKPADETPADETADDDSPVDPDVEEAPEEKPKTVKPGQAHLSGMRDWLKAGIAAIGDDLANQEHPGVEEFSKGVLQSLMEKCDECEGKLKEAYPDASDDKDEEGDSTMKSAAAFASTGNVRYRLRAAGARLDEVLKSAGLSKDHRAIIVDAKAALIKTADEAKKIAEAVSPDVEKQLAAAKANFAALTKSVNEISQLIPAVRK